ncbi:NADH:ubiquinone reductase (Na(+)-transporting) subunit D [Chlamydia pecorum]|uniref:Na(+)-translocating NADH-quinone reductase subunit D n=1 Tax=Chlamydia pecorum TaxID=85991 RepID=A0AA40PPX1_9CHLA|nr:NADH:ubiquinone reductase (Na(+)-transporting) subunit D [Chlamydia pecorum]AGW37852.1 Na(+)-translocating NADH-quinone reductase subunit D [Chlamydia pecorum PV3056/3]KTF28584.1 ubiquinone oxidoreductase, Na(+)-translocating, D subunit [Chlamydia pecorum]KZN26607.1 ubiquinone oxidoreductase, Na(+)-translocating, D subunit [Chlamydia pecorum]KZN26877.1 ubiquinone oxidoreductase, Na(+)-translocating, D subunit [Chlamydia pecorum]
MTLQRSYKSYFLDPLWRNNQILTSILGICSALAVTTTVNTAITMGLAVSIVTGSSSFFVSLLRKVTPDSVRMITQLIIISLFVIVIDQFLKAFLFTISKTLSVFVGLIITNCIVMGRAESFAKHSPPIPAFLDGFSAGLGYGWVLVFISIIRELFGSGTLLGYRMIPLAFYGSTAHPDGYQNLSLMVLAPSAFFILGIMIWIVNILDSKKTKR